MRLFVLVSSLFLFAACAVPIASPHDDKSSLSGVGGGVDGDLRDECLADITGMPFDSPTDRARRLQACLREGDPGQDSYLIDRRGPYPLPRGDNVECDEEDIERLDERAAAIGERTVTGIARACAPSAYVCLTRSSLAENDMSVQEWMALPVAEQAGFANIVGCPKTVRVERLVLLPSLELSGSIGAEEVFSSDGRTENAQSTDRVDAPRALADAVREINEQVRTTSNASGESNNRASIALEISLSWQTVEEYGQQCAFPTDFDQFQSLSRLQGDAEMLVLETLSAQCGGGSGFYK